MIDVCTSPKLAPFLLDEGSPVPAEVRFHPDWTTVERYCKPLFTARIAESRHSSVSTLGPGGIDAGRVDAVVVLRFVVAVEMTSAVARRSARSPGVTAATVDFDFPVVFAVRVEAGRREDGVGFAVVAGMFAVGIALNALNRRTEAR